MKYNIYVLLLVIALSAVLSCKNKTAKRVTTAEKFQNAATNYAAIVVASYEDSCNEVKKLRDLIYDFVDNPTAAKHEACKKQWLAARAPYGQTEAYRFYGGPIDNEENGPEGLINAWPMDENFIDYVEGKPEAGLINDPDKYPTISKKVLADLNESISEESIFTGYHAIEFLLWGQDLYTDSPGKRPYTDFVKGSGGTAKNQDRRGQYLKVVADLLLDNLNEVRNQWGPNGAFQKKFLAQDNKKILTDIFTSLSELAKGELSGERMFVAVDSKDQENEHSCFSDNTNDDILQNFNGLVNVYTGTYKCMNGETISGQSYAAMAKKFDTVKAKKVEDLIKECRTNLNAIPHPFDQAILNNREVILKAVSSLEDLSDAFADVAVVLKSK